MHAGGIFADGGGWTPGAVWSSERNAKTRALQNVLRDKDLGLDAIGPMGAVSFLDNLFGSKDATESVRAQLGELHARLLSAMERASGDKLLRMVAIEAQLQRHLQTFPANDAEKANWMAGAASIAKEVKRLLPVPLGTVLAVGAVAVAGLVIAVQLVRGRP